MLLIQYISRFKGWIKINILKRDSQAIIQKLHFSDRICTRSRSLQTTSDNHYGFFRWRYVQKSWTGNILITKASRWRTSHRQRLAFLILPDYLYASLSGKSSYAQYWKRALKQHILQSPSVIVIFNCRIGYRLTASLYAFFAYSAAIIVVSSYQHPVCR